MIKQSQKRKRFAECYDQIRLFFKAVSYEGKVTYDEKNQLEQNPDYTMNAHQVTKAVDDIFGTDIL